MLDWGGFSIASTEHLCVVEVDDGDDAAVPAPPRPFLAWQNRIKELKHKLGGELPAVASCTGPLTLATYTGRVFGYNRNLVRWFFHSGAVYTLDNTLLYRAVKPKPELLVGTFAPVVDSPPSQQPQQQPGSLHVFVSLNPAYAVSASEEAVIQREMLKLGRTHIGVLSIKPAAAKLVMTRENFSTLHEDIATLVQQHQQDVDTVSVSFAGPMPLAYTLGLELGTGKWRHFVAFERPLVDSGELQDEALVVSFKDL